MTTQSRFRLLYIALALAVLTLLIVAGVFAQAEQQPVPVVQAGGPAWTSVLNTFFGTLPLTIGAIGALIVAVITAKKAAAEVKAVTAAINGNGTAEKPGINGKLDGIHTLVNSEHSKLTEKIVAQDLKLDAQTALILELTKQLATAEKPKDAAPAAVVPLTVAVVAMPEGASMPEPKR